MESSFDIFLVNVNMMKKMCFVTENEVWYGTSFESGCLA